MVIGEDRKAIFTVAETQRLRIVSFSSGDTDLLYQLTRDAEVMKYFPRVLTHDETDQMLQKILDHYQQYGHCFWKLLSIEEGEFIGMVGLLHQGIEGVVETEIVYRIVRKWWNRGYATEAALACKDYAENTLGRKRLISIIRPERTGRPYGLHINSVRKKRSQSSSVVKDTTYMSIKPEEASTRRFTGLLALPGNLGRVPCRLFSDAKFRKIMVMRESHV